MADTHPPPDTPMSDAVMALFPHPPQDHYTNDTVLAPFPHWNIGSSESVDEVFLVDLHRQGVKTFPHPHLKDQPLSLYFVGRLVEVDLPTEEDLEFPECFDVRLLFNFAFMDRDGKAVSNEELHSYNLKTIDELTRLTHNLGEQIGKLPTYKDFFWADEEEKVITVDIESDLLFFESPVPKVTTLETDEEDAELREEYYHKAPLIFDDVMKPVALEEIEGFIHETEDFFIQAVPYEEHRDGEVTIRLILAAMYAIPT